MRNILNINKNWMFYKDTADISSVVSENAESVNIPHTWNAFDGQDGGNDYFRGSCCYMKELKKSELPKGELYYLEINGANNSADVYVNGKFMAHHDNGYSTWRVNITDVLEEENTIAVVVDNAPTELVYPQTADFTFYGGLYRDVNVIAVNTTHFDLDHFGGKGLKVTPVMEGSDAKVAIETFVEGFQTGDKLVCTIKEADGTVVDICETTELRCDFVIKNAHLWDGVKDPYLYTCEVAIHREEMVLDEVCARFGCRSFRIDPENGFILNGREYPLRGVSRHQDRFNMGNALLPEHHIEDMEYICEMGANTIRLAHYQHDQFFYDLCDERGMVVWAEIPYISRHMPEANDNTVLQMKELIVQNYHHPSICVWGLSNEITMDGAKDPDMIHQHRILNDLVHDMDKTRLTTMAIVSMCPMDSKYIQIPDTVAWNHYFGWYGGTTDQNGPWFDKFHEKFPNIPVGCSEYGCEALNWHTSDPKQGDYTEEYQAYYHEELIKQLFTRKYIWATHVWNMFDFGADARGEGVENGQNHKGLITIDRKYKKDSFYAYKAWLSDEPFVHLCGKRYVNRVEDVTKVTIYSNQPEVELFANGVSLGKKTAPDHFFYFDVPNKGETKLEAVAGTLKDESVINKVDTFDESYRLVEKNAILNWFDITEREGYCSLNTPISEILGTIRGKIFLAYMTSKLMKQIKKNQTNGKNKSGFQISDGLLQLVGSFTILRISSMGGMVGLEFTKEQLLDYNKKLNRIPLPKKK